ncbi:hypothetical protein PLICRDRAFT_116954 [Plicaturopsis crispa FD-325 SS-3]|uniref:UBC core domain-containing protein n=1 Tax=Plicaturopsis crispa FD-325 SS-3 TaxID=944288 RepID=A0A0C9T6G4_PLICR|nr:hypothetical protein PLICRDRAFT_116954 [Plicaturopsis crispa FD-325 SS-3]
MGDAIKTAKNATLKGRKRFTADLKDAVEACTRGFEYRQLQVTKLRSGDDEGCIEFEVRQESKRVVSVNLLVSDTSEYPDHHTFFAYSPDADLPAKIQDLVEAISSEPPRPIEDTVEKFLHSVSKVTNPDTHTKQELRTHQLDDEESDGADDDDDGAYEAYDDLDYFAGPSSKSMLQLPRLQRDFVETVAAGYRPGFIRFGADNFSVSVSLPVIALANDIPPRALMAWDRRLLSRSQHLTLLITGFRGCYPPLASDGQYSTDAKRLGTSLKFAVGLTPRYKPGKHQAQEVGRNFGLIQQDDEIRDAFKPAESDVQDAENGIPGEDPIEGALPGDIPVEEEEEDPGRFDKFSLSSSLESLLEHSFVRVVQYRRAFGLGWAGAEKLVSEVERTQMKPEDILSTQRRVISAADKEEAKLGRSYSLPGDPLQGPESEGELNLPLIAFCYLVRRLTLCTRFCPVCHNTIKADFEVLKPYVCDSKLCAYQYYSLNRGASLEYEIINNPGTVDLLVSIAYTAACERVLDHPLPVGLGLRVSLPQPSATDTKPPPEMGTDGLCDFDELDKTQMQISIANLINSLPSITDMKKHLERKVKAGKAKPKLKDMDASILPSAWTILRWCVASCTAHLEELTADEDLVRNIDPCYRQFRFSVGAPDAEAKFKAAVVEAQKVDKNALKYPSLFAFHGSPLKNWHSIIRHGLWAKTVAHGRAYGDGKCVYFAKEGAVSTQTYAQASPHSWRNSKIVPTTCTTLAEIVNLPSKFTSTSPYLVVPQTEWIICRYLIVRTGALEVPEESAEREIPKVPTVRLDPAHPLTMSSASVRFIPEPSYKLEQLLSARQQEYMEEDYDQDDAEIFDQPASQTQSQTQAPTEREIIEIDDSDDDAAPSGPLEADWEHDAEWVDASVSHLLPPPTESTPSATMALQRELRAMLREQDNAKSLKDLGWYMPPDKIGDNLFQWIVELHSFDSALPIAQDLKARGLNSIIFEIRFPPSFPLSPPFFRIIKPRFLPFIQGGGGHVTGGGSMCMDLLTADGWLPSYSISAVLLVIKVAISNLDPRPARLASNWDTPYGVHEALEGYMRAARTHGWKVSIFRHCCYLA